MAKTRVPVQGTVGKSLRTVDSTSSVAELAAALTQLQQQVIALQRAGEANPSGLSPTDWNLITGKPPDLDKRSPGPPGEDGQEGERGPPGSAGAAGAAGYRGPPGEDGLPGEDGVPGPAGPQGPQGPTGASGTGGGSAIPGPEGAQGDDGERGPPGVAGAAGPTGPTGVSGLMGPPGMGETGDDGERGPPGVNASALSQQRGASWSNALATVVVPAVDVPITIAEDCSIVDVTVLTKGGTGSCVIDIWRIAFGSYPPTVVNSITGSNLPTISSGVSYRDTTLSTWTTNLSKGDTLLFHLNSASVFTEITVLITLQKMGVVNGANYTDQRARDAVGGALTNTSTIAWTYDSVGGTIKADVVTTGISIGASGSIPLPGGLILKWGNLSKLSNAQGTAVTFANAFPTACYNVVVSETGSTPTNDNGWTSRVGSITASGFVVNSNDFGVGAPSPTITVYWQAIGS